ncbi:hypothetical protein STEG23_027623 [Scotinomys teguina]
MASDPLRLQLQNAVSCVVDGDPSPLEEQVVLSSTESPLQPYPRHLFSMRHCMKSVTGRCGSVLVRLIPAPRGTGIVSAPVPKKLLLMAGIDDCYTSARGCTATLGNFAKATFDAISKTYSYLIPDLWKEIVFTKSPYQEFTDHLVKTHTRVSVQRTQAPAVAIT